jgi:hypothetical protein
MIVRERARAAGGRAANLVVGDTPMVAGETHHPRTTPAGLRAG